MVLHAQEVEAAANEGKKELEKDGNDGRLKFDPTAILPEVPEDVRRAEEDKNQVGHGRNYIQKYCSNPRDARRSWRFLYLLVYLSWLICAHPLTKRK